MTRRLILCLGFLSAAVIAGIVVCHRSFFNLPSRVGEQAILSVNGGRQLFTNTKSSQSPKKLPVTASSAEEPAWLAEALNDPDPRVRLNAVEAWARNPTDSLDPVTYALVDPDESVRARAQELLEEALARR